MAAALRVCAPAKLNLDLYVTGREGDGPHRGYHLLDSLVVFLDVGDWLEAAPSDSLGLTVDGPFAGGLGTGPDNLVIRAAEALARVVDVAPLAALRLTKNIPVAAGLGGGSADAAAALRVLARLWRVEPDPAALAELALGLGADVPVCLRGEAVVMRGVGEALAPPPSLPAGLAVVLANPRRPLATAQVFAARQGDFSAPPDRGGAPWTGRNDLQDAAVRLMPEAGTMLEQLSALSGARGARLSGSGPTGFALFDDRGAAEAAAHTLAAAQPGWWVQAAGVAGGAPSG